MTSPEIITAAKRAVELSPSFNGNAFHEHAGTHFGSIASALLAAEEENARLRKALETVEQKTPGARHSDLHALRYCNDVAREALNP